MYYTRVFHSGRAGDAAERGLLQERGLHVSVLHRARGCRHRSGDCRRGSQGR